MECEVDEIALRCVARHSKEGVDGVWWLRFFGMARRGSSKVSLAPVEDRFAASSGQGGGGSLSTEELVRVLRADTDRPVLARRSILHTDGARSYCKIGFMKWLDKPGLLNEAFESELFVSAT